MIFSTLVRKTAVSTMVERPVQSNYDVIVAGLGEAGSLAAITAAQKGLKVLGLETLGCMGGVGTAAGIFGYYFGSTGGKFEAIDAKIADLEKKGYTRTRGLNPELKKYLLEQEALSAGVHLEYESTVIGVFLEGRNVCGVRWISPAGVKEALCSVVVDATGDASVCAMAGCETRWGRESDGGVQPYSNGICVLNEDVVCGCSADCGYVDQRDEVSINEAVLYSGTLPLHLREDYSRGSRVLYVAPQLGVREGRYIVGEENLTFSDFLADRLSKEPVYFAYANLDNHRKDLAFESELLQEWISVSSLWGLNAAVPVPLGAMIPKGYGGILAVGRSIAADHDMASFIRMKRDAQKSGEAAAIATYLSVSRKKPLSQLDYSELEPLLRETNCINNAYSLRMEIPYEKENASPVHWLTDMNEIKAGLDTERAGVAIWSAYRLGKPAEKELERWIRQDSNVLLKKNSALALGLLGSDRAIPILEEMVREKDIFLSKTSNLYNQMRGISAICLLGRLADAQIVPELLRILSHPEDFEGIEPEYNEFLSIHEELHFQFFSYSLMALLRIGDARPECRDEIKEAVHAVLEKDDFSPMVTLKSSGNQIYRMDEIVKRVVKRMGY